MEWIPYKRGSAMRDPSHILHQSLRHQLSRPRLDLSKRTFLPQTALNNSSATLIRLRIRIASLFPALHLLREALPLIKQTLQPRRRIKVLSTKMHIGQLRMDHVVHPNQDPFSRGRIPYLECSSPRKVKPSIVELVKDWENLEIYRYSNTLRDGY